MILFVEDTRKVGSIGLAATLMALCAMLYFGWPPQPDLTIFSLFLVGVAVFYAYLIAIRRRRVVSLLGDQLIWNTFSLTAAPLSVSVAQIRRYRIEWVLDTHLDTGSVLLASGWQRIGDLPRKVHRHIYAELRRLNPAVLWEES